MQQASLFADVKQTSIAADVDLVQFMCNFVLSNRLEFAMFFSAMLGYGILFCVRLPKIPLHDKKQESLVERPSCVCQKAATGLLTSAAALSQMVKSMWDDDKDVQMIANEMSIFIQKHPEECDISCVNDVLEELAGLFKSDLMQAFFDILPDAGLKRNQRTFEILLKVHVAARDFYEVQALVADMDASNMPLSARAEFLVMKGALQVHDFDQAIKYFKSLRSSWELNKTSEALVPQSIMLSFVDLASRKNNLGELVQELRGLPVSEKTIDAMLSKCTGVQGCATAKSIESLARAQRETIQDSTYSMLIKALSSKPTMAKPIIEEVLGREGSTFSPDLALSVLDFCKGTSDMVLADQLLKKMKPKQVNVIAAFIWFYIETGKFDTACDVYELDMQPVCSPQAMEAGLRESIVDAAVLSGRSQLAEKLVVNSQSQSIGCFALITHVGEAFESCIDMVARWNAMVSYWVVLIF